MPAVDPRKEGTVTVELTREEAESLSRAGWCDHPVSVHESGKAKLRTALDSPSGGTGGGEGTMVEPRQFEREYAERSGLSVGELRHLGRVVIACGCGDCKGFQSINRETAERVGYEIVWPFSEREGECYSCGEEQPPNDCQKSKRPCGHHCNCSWVGDLCHWCGKEFGETEPVKTQEAEDASPSVDDSINAKEGGS